MLLFHFYVIDSVADIYTMKNEWAKSLDSVQLDFNFCKIFTQQIVVRNCSHFQRCFRVLAVGEVALSTLLGTRRFKLLLNIKHSSGTVWKLWSNECIYIHYNSPNQWIHTPTQILITKLVSSEENKDVLFSARIFLSVAEMAIEVLI